MTGVGVVVVSHSAPLAEAALDLALQMVPNGRPRVELAAGTSDGGIGTDAARVAEAIDSLADCDGVLVFMDLGSAVLSAEMALEFTTTETPVRLTSAPFVEGLLAAVVSAAGGADLDAVDREARAALTPKTSQLGDEPQTDPTAAAPSADAAPAADAISRDVTVVNAAGLHARPAGQVVGTLTGRDVSLSVENLTKSGPSVPVEGPTALLATRGRQGEVLRFTASGRHAQTVLDDIAAMFAEGFGEPTEGEPRSSAPVATGMLTGPVVLMPDPIAEPSDGRTVPPEDRDAEAARIDDAAEFVAADLRTRAAAANNEAQEILTAAGQLCVDPAVVKQAAALVRDTGVSAARAVWSVYGSMADQLAGLGGRMAERATDLRDARSRIVAALTGQAMPTVPELTEPSVLVAHDLAPADAAALDPAHCLAVVDEVGGDTSHASIILRELGVAMISGAAGAWSQPQGPTVSIDLGTGQLDWS